MRWLLGAVFGVGLLACSSVPMEIRSTEHHRKACHQGSMEGCTDLGKMHYKDQKVTVQ